MVEITRLLSHLSKLLLQEQDYKITSFHFIMRDWGVRGMEQEVIHLSFDRLTSNFLSFTAKGFLLVPPVMRLFCSKGLPSVNFVVTFSRNLVNFSPIFLINWI